MATVTHMGVAATDHVVLDALRNIPEGCARVGYEFFPRKYRRPWLGTEPCRSAVSHFPRALPRRHRRGMGLEDSQHSHSPAATAPSAARLTMT